MSRIASLVVAALALTACTSGTGAGGTGASGPHSRSSAIPHNSSSRPIQPQPSRSDRSSATAGPRWDHVVVVMMENHSYDDIIGSAAAPYLNRLAARGASFSRFYAETHPSEPNYLALFSGSTHGVTSDQCPLHFSGTNLGAELRAAGHSVVGYSEGLPRTGYTGCTFGSYVRKHAPWVDFTDLPMSVNQPMTAFPSNPTALPAMSFVIPNLDHDMHDGTVTAGDRWLQAHLSRYADWAAAHRSLLVITWDEDDRSESNRIPTIAVGAGVRTGIAPERADHYRLLRTIEDGFDVRPLGRSAHERAIPELSN